MTLLWIYRLVHCQPVVLTPLLSTYKRAKMPTTRTKTWESSKDLLMLLAEHSGLHTIKSFLQIALNYN